MIVFGMRKFGWVDEVEGLGTVATTFLHVMFVPLIPTGTHLMFDDDRGISIPLSIKSILVAWIRSFLFWSGAASVIAVPATWGCTCLTAAPLLGAWALMPMLVRTASPVRAQELRDLVGA